MMDKDFRSKVKTDASTPKKGKGLAVPDKHWEMHNDPCVHQDTKSTRGAEFSPIRSNHRITTYNKTNKCDN